MTTKINSWTVVSPAYGRDYKSGKEAKVAFLSGVDFRLESMQHSGTYCSIRDFESGCEVEVRFKNLTGLVVVTVP